MNSLLDFLFGCAHARITFPMTPVNRKTRRPAGETYIVCLECGAEFTYDWDEMRVRPEPPRGETLEVEA